MAVVGTTSVAVVMAVASASVIVGAAKDVVAVEVETAPMV